MWSLSLLALYRPLIVNSAQPDTDSSIFIYIGSHIASGGAPYRDYFDHKGPLTYWINALPYELGFNSLSAIAWMEALGLIGAVCALGLTLHQRVGALGAWMGFFALCATLNWAIQNGNHVEAWALMLACVAVWAAFADWDARLRGFLVGVCFAGALLLRPNEALFGIVLLAIIWKFDCVHRRRFITAFVLGLALVLAVSLATLWRQNALQSAFDQYVVFNLSYIKVSWAERLHSLLKGVEKLSARIVLLLALWGLFLCWRSSTHLTEKSRPLLWFAAWALPLQLLSAALSGHGFAHYFLAPLLPLAILCALALGSWTPTIYKTSKLAVLLGVLTFATGIVQLSKSLGRIDSRYPEDEKVSAFIRNNSAPSDGVVVWGNNVSWLLLSNRKSATRALYQKPIFAANFPLAKRYQAEFFEQIQTRKPRLILDATPLKNDLHFPQQIPQLHQLLTRDYRILSFINYENRGKITVWVLKNKLETNA